MSSPIDNDEFLRIGRKHNNRKSHSAIAEIQSEKRNKKLAEQVELLPKKMRAKLLPSAGHGKQIGNKRSFTIIPSTKRRNKNKSEDNALDASNQYQETIQGNEDAYAEKEEEERDKFFEQHFKLLRDMGEEEYQEYLGNVFDLNAHEEDMSGCQWIMINNKIESYELRRKKNEKELARAKEEFGLSEEELDAYQEHLDDLDAYRMYLEETGTYVNPEYLKSLRDDIANFKGKFPETAAWTLKLDECEKCSSEEWDEMVDAVNREQGYY